MKRKPTRIALLAVALITTAPVLAQANTLPNSYTPTGSSWISVSESSKVYLEPFGDTGYDDYDIYYVPAGVTCESNGVIADGPFLTTNENLGSGECDDGVDPVDPIDTTTREGAMPFGFTINFFGTDYSSAWPNTNGGIFFDEPDSGYDDPMAQMAHDAQSSVMFAFAGDLYYYSEESNFWTAQTTVDGKNAVVFAWENFHNCCRDSASPEDMTFQIVLIDLGGGDFNAYFNYESIKDFSQGYDGPAVTIDLETGVTVGSNIVTATGSLAGIEEGVCYQGAIDSTDLYQFATDQQFVGDLDNAGPYFKLENAALNTISLWNEDSCSTGGIDANIVQDVAEDGYAYVEFEDTNSEFNSVAVGWATYDLVTHKIDWTEILRNLDSDEFENDAVNPLNTRSLNTTVPGRFVIGQRGGQTVVDQASIGSTGTLAATGFTMPQLIGTSGLLVVFGALLIVAWRRSGRLVE